MPASFLTEAERQHRSAFPNEIAQADLITYFTLSSADLAQIRKQRGSANRLGFALQLCALRYLGFIPQQQETIPDEVIHYVAEQLQIQPEALAHYGQRPNTGVDHLKAITQYLGFRKATTEDVERLRM